MLLFLQAILVGAAIGLVLGLCSELYRLYRLLADVVAEVRSDLKIAKAKREKSDLKSPAPLSV